MKISARNRHERKCVAVDDGVASPHVAMAIGGGLATSAQPQDMSRKTTGDRTREWSSHLALTPGSRAGRNFSSSGAVVARPR